MTILNINLNAQDDIKSCEYWFIEDFSEDLLVAYHENCEKHVYTRSGKKILGIKDAYTMLEKVEEAEDGPVIKITTEKHHTYISNGVLSHNDKAIE